MKQKFLTVLLIAATLMTTGMSCKKRNKTNISEYDTKKSHQMGKNCMDCHRSGKWGKGWFTVAGTVYDSMQINTFKNATIKLYTQPNGTGALKYTIHGDAKGNFFTTETIDFGNGLYPSVQGSETTKHMTTAITEGKCNSCHNNSTSKIWTK